MCSDDGVRRTKECRPDSLPHCSQRLGVGNTSGILLFGPSGCGKSLLVKELTAQAKVNCVSVKVGLHVARISRGGLMIGAADEV